MDQKLEDIIAKKKTSRRGGAVGRRPKRSAVGAGAGAKAGALGVPDARVQRAKAAASTPSFPQPQAEKIQVSGLPGDVNEAQVKELFSSTVGPLREATIHYDSHGKTKGIATVIFNRRGDGTKAFDLYNGRLIDGKKPMKIELMFDPSKLAQQPTTLASRVAPAPVAKTNGTSENAQRGGGRPRRGGGGRGRGGKSNPRPKKTAEDLDAEMEEYGKSSAVPAAAAGGDTQMAE